MVCGPVLEYIDQLHAPLSLCLHLAAEWSHLAGQGAYHGPHLNGWEGEDKGGAVGAVWLNAWGGGGSYICIKFKYIYIHMHKLWLNHSC
jgi:hypothetical protein